MIPIISRIITTKPIIAAVDMPFFLHLPSSSTPLPEQQSAPSVVAGTASSSMHAAGPEEDGAERGAPPEEDGTERGAPPELVARGEPPIINAYCPEPVKLRALPMDEAGPELVERGDPPTAEDGVERGDPPVAEGGVAACQPAESQKN